MATENLIAELTGEQAYAFLSQNLNLLQKNGYEIMSGRIITVSGQSAYIIGRKIKTDKMEYLLMDYTWSSDAKMLKLRSQRQHTIWPKSFLKNYYPNGRIAVYDFIEKEWKNYGPSTFGVRNKHYTPDFERTLMKFESNLTPALECLLKGKITQVMREKLSQYIITDICRKYINIVDEMDIIESTFENVSDDLMDLVEADVVESELDFFRANSSDYMRVTRSRSLYDARIFDWLEKCQIADLTWEVISKKSEHSFLLSDMPFPMELFHGPVDGESVDFFQIGMSDNFHITFPINCNNVLVIRPREIEDWFERW